MKKITLLLVICISLCTFAQAQIPPQAFNYSAVARNAAGQPIATSTIGIQITILKTSTTGTSVYSENHFVNTDAYGLFNLVVGGGAIQNGSMNTIDWSADNYYLKVGMDANGGTNFLNMGTTQLLSVPYALHSKTAESLIGVGATDNQQLSVSLIGDTLYLQNGGFVIIPGISAANNSGGGGNGIYTSGNGVTDIEGNFYQSIIINGQEWMAENLRSTRYSNGDTIPNVSSDAIWANLTSEAYCFYFDGSVTYYNNPMYNWFVINDTRNVCPNGWHVPTDSEWTTFINFLDPNADGGNNSSNSAGGKMKSTDTYWQIGDLTGTNESGFTALPKGWRFSDGSFMEMDNALWWSSSEYDSISSVVRAVFVSANNAYRGVENKGVGLYVRCLKD